MKGLLGTLGALVVAAGVCWQPASALSATSNTHRILLGGKVLTIKQGFANAGPKAAVVFNGKRLGGYDHEAVRLIRTTVHRRHVRLCGAAHLARQPALQRLLPGVDGPQGQAGADQAVRRMPVGAGLSPARTGSPSGSRISPSR